LIGLSLSLVSVCVTAADEPAAAEAPQNLPSPLVSRVESGEFIGDEQLRRVYVTVGASQYGSIVPHGLRVDTASTDRVSLVDTGMHYFLTLRVLPPLPALEKNLEAACRPRLEHNYPKAEVIEMSATEVAGRRCPVFDLRWTNGDGLVRSVRVAYLSTTGGLIEFTAVAEPALFGEALTALGGLMQRLQTNENGMLQMVTFRLPDNS
jgi:hypothetical protein